MSDSIATRATMRALATKLVISSVMLSASAAAQTMSMPAHQQSAAAMSRDEIARFAKINLAIGKVRDSVQLALGLAENNPDKPAQALRAHLRQRVAEILAANKMTDDEFRHTTFVLSSDDATRAVFDTVVSQITGIPLPSKLLPASATGTLVKVPPGMVGAHIGHVVNAFQDTPAEQGLLPMAF